MNLRPNLILYIIGIVLTSCAVFQPKIEPRQQPPKDVLFAPASTGPTVIKRPDRIALAPEDVLNAYRRQHKLSDLRQAPDLNTLATSQALSMARTETLSHDVGGSFTSRVAHLNAKYAAENVAVGMDTINATMDQWKRSYEHNKVMLEKDANQFGLGKAQASDGKWWWCLIVVRR